jgi:hypothetical protein
MTGHFILADVTSHRRGFGVQPIIDAAARRAETHQNVEKIIWLVPTHLIAAFKTAHGIEANHEIRNCDIIGPPLWDVIRKEIESVASTSPGCHVTVVSWDQFIYAEARGYGRGVIAEKWFDWLTANPVPRFPGLPARQPRIPEPGIVLPSAEELQRIVVAYLRSIGATDKTPMYRSQLRPGLMRANPSDLRVDIQNSSRFCGCGQANRRIAPDAWQGNHLGDRSCRTGCVRSRASRTDRRAG